ncbi:MAG: GNAT family N-acetyltransferase [Actinomycetia bacterium]|nr:GNAT family N-acetyltransferase [Actinomycetes bacterium]
MINNFGREFNPETDIIKLQIFLAEMRNKVSQAGYFHLGDLLYRINLSSNNLDILKDIRIWENRERVNGFVLFLPTENNPEFQLRPELYKSNILNEMISWTIERAKQLNLGKIEVSCLDIDYLKKEFLIENGFKQFEDPFVCMERNLDSLPPCFLPKDYTFISYNDRPDLPGIYERTDTIEEYLKMCLLDKYKDDLGLRVCYRNKEIVAGCICWYDDIDNCGLFEPVGTIEKHQKKGLAFAVMAKTLENLKKYGVDKVYIHTSEKNLPAIKLYEKLGFRITNIDNGFELEIK